MKKINDKIGLSLNPKKCGILFLRKNYKADLRAIKDIPIVSSYKYLGITFSNKLKVNLRLASMENTANKYCNLMKILNS